MQFSTVASIAAAAAVASAHANVTTATATRNQTTLVTITHCEENSACTAKVSPALVSTATVTIDNVVTAYETWCPLTTTEAAKPPASTAKPPAPSNQTVPPVETPVVSSFTGAAAKALPAAGALFAGAAALLL
ncbi:AaceriAGR049Wp [[Ashbya] aceris (nom. inval.)]|nr:AaceriAGR049Wp [[Ashbya] aceris (nom. inval.)]